MQIGFDSSYASVRVVADLSRDFSGFSVLSDEEKLEWLSESPQPVRKVKANASPMLMPIDEIDSFQGYDLDALADAGEILATDSALCADLTRHFLEMISREYSNEFVEQQLYDRFPDRDTEQCWAEFHSSPWKQRWAILKSMPDIRYRKLGMRLIFEHSSNSLHPKALQLMNNFLNSKVSGGKYENPPWRTKEDAIAELEDIQIKQNYPDGLDIIVEYQHYIDRLAP